MSKGYWLRKWHYKLKDWRWGLLPSKVEFSRISVPTRYFVAWSILHLFFVWLLDWDFAARHEIFTLFFLWICTAILAFVALQKTQDTIKENRVFHGYKIYPYRATHHPPKRTVILETIAVIWIPALLAGVWMSIAGLTGIVEWFFDQTVSLWTVLGVTVGVVFGALVLMFCMRLLRRIWWWLRNAKKIEELTVKVKNLEELEESVKATIGLRHEYYEAMVKAVKGDHGYIINDDVHPETPLIEALHCQDFHILPFVLSTVKQLKERHEGANKVHKEKILEDCTASAHIYTRIIAVLKSMKRRRGDKRLGAIRHVLENDLERLVPDQDKREAMLYRAQEKLEKQTAVA